MGIIQRQSIKYGIVSYLGVAIGALSTIFIYPRDLTAYGLVQFIMTTALLFLPLITLGIHWLPIKYLPYVRDENSGHRGFLRLLLIVLLLNSIAFSAVFLLFQDEILQFVSVLNPKKDPLFDRYFRYLLPYSIIVSYNALLTQYSMAFERIAFPQVLNNLLLKVMLPALFILMLMGYLDYTSLLNGVLLLQMVVLIGLVGYLYHLGQWRLTPVDFAVWKPLLRGMGSYSLFAMLGGIGTMLAFRIDSLMIPALINFSSNGAYSIAIFISNVIAIPILSIRKISGPIISQAWARKDIAHIEKLYKEATLNLFWIGSVLFALIMASLDELIELLPSRQDLSILYGITALLGIGRISEMFTAVSTEIVFYSRYYRINLLAVFLLGVINIFFNYYFIMVLDLGIWGVALATMMSVIFYQVFIASYIYLQFGYHPFSLGLLPIGLVSVLLFYIGRWLNTPYPLLTIVIRSLFIVFTFITIMYVMRISPQWNRLIRGSLDILFFWRRRRS